MIDAALHAASPRSWVVCDTLAVRVSETEQTPVPLGDTWGVTSATAFGSLWIPDDMSGRLLRIASADDPVRIDLPLTGEGADLVLTVLPGAQGIWIVDSDEGVGIMQVSPRDNRVRHIVRPNADLTGVRLGGGYSQSNRGGFPVAVVAVLHRVRAYQPCRAVATSRTDLLAAPDRRAGARADLPGGAGSK